MSSVLIIDDDEHVTKMLECHLKEEGHEVTITHSGEEGMTRAEKMAPDLILLDVILPDVTGFQMCNRLRKNSTTKDTPIIMMTGAARFSNHQMYGRQRGANEYIFKPFNLVDMGSLVHKYLHPEIRPQNTTVQSNGQANTGHQSIDHLSIEHLSVEHQTIEQQSPEFQNVDSPIVHPQSAEDEITGHQPSPEPAALPRIEPEDNLAALNSFLKRALEKDGIVINDDSEIRVPKIQIPEPVEPLVPFHEVTVTRPTLAVLENNTEPAAETAKAPELGSKERFIDFGLEIIALASRMNASRSEMHLADQLLRTSLSAGAKINESQSAETRQARLTLAQDALKDLREAEYWLTLAGRTGLLKSLCKPELEKTCQSLGAELIDFIRLEKDASSR